MKITTNLIIFLLLNIYPIFSQIDTESYLNKCDYEIKRLIEKLPESEREKWKNEFQNINMEYDRIGSEVEKSKKFYKDLKAENVYAYKYLNAVYNYLLPNKTNLVNAIGDSLCNGIIGHKVETKIDSIENFLMEYSNTPNAPGFGNIFKQFLILKNQFKSEKTNPPQAFFTIFEEKRNAYANPTSIKEFVVYDWEKSIENLELISGEIDNLAIDMYTKDFILVRDPMPYFPIIAQFATLIILLSNLFVNFGFEIRTKRIVVIGVIISVFTGIFLLVYNSSTFWNSILNILIPGILYLVYYLKNKDLLKK